MVYDGNSFTHEWVFTTFSNDLENNHSMDYFTVMRSENLRKKVHIHNSIIAVVHIIICEINVGFFVSFFPLANTPSSEIRLVPFLLFFTKLNIYTKTLGCKRIE